MNIGPLLLVIQLSGTSSAQASEMVPAFFTGDRLYEICAGPEEYQCWMYVAGVIDGTFQAEANETSRSICRTPITNREAAHHVLAYLRENVSVREKAAAVAVKLALQHELACEDPAV